MPFAAYPAPFIRETPDGTKKQQLLWGDFVSELGRRDGEWVEVRGRGENGWMREDELQQERLLEVNFVDVGQGDGAFLVTPDDEFLVIDAGEKDNLYRFLRWRFNLRNHPEREIRLKAGILSHPDSDHYRGFDPLFASDQLRFDTIYHNCLVERRGDDRLGTRREVDGVDYVAEVIRDQEGVERIVGDDRNVGRTWYPNLLRDCLRSGRTGELRGLCSLDGFVPGFEEDRELSMRVLGPVPEEIDDQGGLGLRWLGSRGETKNGHSVVLKLEYRDVSVLLGGDLNIPAEEYLLAHYTGLDPEGLDDGDPADEERRRELVEEARETFQVDVAKACHHGSADFSHLYLEAVHPIAVVISSGDDESHAHPRPDALGSFGKAGRGRRPLIFSTELARSARETIRQPQRLRDRIDELFTRRAAAETRAERDAVQEQIDEVLAKLERSIAVYGMINLRSDGRKILMAQKLESPRGATREEFDVHLLEPDEQGELRYVSKH